MVGYCGTATIPVHLMSFYRKAPGFNMHFNTLLEDEPGRELIEFLREKVPKCDFMSEVMWWRDS